MGKESEGTRRDIIMPPHRGKGVRRKGSKEKRNKEEKENIQDFSRTDTKMMVCQNGYIAIYHRLFSAFITSSHERHVIAHTVKLHCRTHKIKLMQA